MIFVLIPIIAIVLAILVIILKKLDSIEKKICLTVLFFNILIILFFRLLWPGETHYADITIFFWINVLINIISLIIVLSSKIKINKKIAVLSIIIYLICMVCMPVYKFEDHVHILVNENKNESTTINENKSNNRKISDILNELNDSLPLMSEIIESYIDYYNCYGIKIKRVCQNN